MPAPEGELLRRPGTARRRDAPGPLRSRRLQLGGIRGRLLLQSRPLLRRSVRGARPRRPRSAWAPPCAPGSRSAVATRGLANVPTTFSTRCVPGIASTASARTIRARVSSAVARVAVVSAGNTSDVEVAFVVDDGQSVKVGLWIASVCGGSEPAGAAGALILPRSNNPVIVQVRSRGECSGPPRP